LASFSFSLVTGWSGRLSHSSKYSFATGSCVSLRSSYSGSEPMDDSELDEEEDDELDTELSLDRFRPPPW
jgi:hypothetical protein